MTRPHRPRPSRGAFLLGSLTAALVAIPAAADPARPPDPPGPAVLLHYRQLVHRQELRFQLGGQEHTKPVGQMAFAFPAGAVPAEGLDQTFRTYCVEPLVPIYAGGTYTFTVEPLNHPAFWHQPETDEGRGVAERRAKFVRELFGRFYDDVREKPDEAAPAFQAAVWELMQETEFPDGPMPFSLETGTFQAVYPDEASTPAFVRRAQGYLRELTGDDSPYLANEALRGTELVRLEDVVAANGTAIQAQLGFRTVAAAGQLAGGDLGGLTGIGGVSATTAAAGIGGGPIGPGGGGGGIGGFGGGPATGGSPPAGAPTTNPPVGDIVRINQPGGPSPQIGEEPPFDPPPIDVPPVDPPVDPPTPIPAPPAAVLGLLAAGLFAARRLRRAAG